MSHSAMSMAEMAEARMRCAGKKPPRNKHCQRCSIRQRVLADQQRLEMLDRADHGQLARR